MIDRVDIREIFPHKDKYPTVHKTFEALDSPFIWLSKKQAVPKLLKFYFPSI